jgi:hypothetical protein
MQCRLRVARAAQARLTRPALRASVPCVLDSRCFCNAVFNTRRARRCGFQVFTRAQPQDFNRTSVIKKASFQ